MACQRCGAYLPTDARACPTCGLAVSTAPDEIENFDPTSLTFTGYLPLYTPLPDGAPGNAPAFWLPMPLNVGTTEDPRYSAGIPRERLPTIPLVQNPDGTAPRIPAVVKRPKQPKSPPARRRVHWLALAFGLLLATLLVGSYVLAVLVGGASISDGVQLTGVTAALLATFLAGVGLLAGGLSRWSARRRHHSDLTTQIPAES